MESLKMEIRPLVNRVYQSLSSKIDALSIDIGTYLKDNIYLLVTLSIVAIVVYGFELFNFNLTIDEEVHATLLGPTLQWIEQGRWGMYLLNTLILPYSTIPFVPLFIALVFHILAILLLVNLWGRYTKLEKIIIASIALAYPGIAYAYTFSTINYGIGFGFFCCALSLYLYVRLKGWKVFYAIIPAAFAISIYQGMAIALVAVYLIYIINLCLVQEQPKYTKFISLIVILAGAAGFSQDIQRIYIWKYG